MLSYIPGRCTNLHMLSSWYSWLFFSSLVFPQLYLHMFAQRKKIIGPKKRDWRSINWKNVQFCILRLLGENTCCFHDALDLPGLKRLRKNSVRSWFLLPPCSLRFTISSSVSRWVTFQPSSLSIFLVNFLLLSTDSMKKFVSLFTWAISVLILCWRTAFSYARRSFKWAHLNLGRYLIFHSVSWYLVRRLPPTLVLFRRSATVLATLLLANSTQPSENFVDLFFLFSPGSTNSKIDTLLQN